MPASYHSSAVELQWFFNNLLERLQQDPFTNVYSEQLITHPNAPPSELHVQDDSGFFFGTSLPNRRSKFFILEKQRETCRKVRDHNLVPLIRVRACGSHNKKS